IATSLPERDRLARRASGQSTAKMAAAVISASANHSVINQIHRAEFNIADATRRKQECRGPERAQRGYITASGLPATANDRQSRDMGKRGPRKFAVTKERYART